MISLCLVRKVQYSKLSIREHWKGTFHLHLRVLSRRNFARFTFSKNPMTLTATKYKKIKKKKKSKTIHQQTAKAVLFRISCTWLYFLSASTLAMRSRGQETYNQNISSYPWCRNKKNFHYDFSPFPLVFKWKKGVCISQRRTLNLIHKTRDNLVCIRHLYCILGPNLARGKTMVSAKLPQFIQKNNNNNNK